MAQITCKSTNDIGNKNINGSNCDLISVISISSISSSSTTVSAARKKDTGILQDKGWAWLIVFASFSILFIGDGIGYSFGLFFIEISKEFPSIGKSQISWISSIMVAITHAVGPFGSILVNQFGCRTVSIVGSIIASVGFGCSYFASNPQILYVTMGLCGGLGFGLMYLPAMVILPQYFIKRRAFAMGIAVCGSGLGTFFFEMVFGFMLEEFNWRQSLAIGSGIIFLSAVIALLYPSGRKPPLQDQFESQEKLELHYPSKSSACCKGLKLSGKLLDLSLLKNPVFLIFSFCDMLISVGFNVPYIYLPEIEKQEDPDGRSTLLGIIGVSTVFSRICMGYLSDKHFADNRHFVYSSSLVLAGIGTICSPHLTSIWWLRGFAALYGLCMGTYVSQKSVILVDLIGLHKLTDGFGLLLLIQAIGFVSGPPIVGLLYDIYGVYKFGFYFAGTVIGTSGLILFSIPFVHRRICKS